jgi:hypothetical protein
VKSYGLCLLAKCPVFYISRPANSFLPQVFTGIFPHVSYCQNIWHYKLVETYLF